MIDPHPPASLPCHLCRCEEVGEADVRAAVAAGARTVNDVKRLTRAGMGPCQGIYCVPAIAVVIEAETGQPMTAIGPMTARPPLRPLPLAALAGIGGGDDAE